MINGGRSENLTLEESLVVQHTKYIKKRINRSKVLIGINIDLEDTYTEIKHVNFITN